MKRNDMNYEVRKIHLFGNGDKYTEVVAKFWYKGDAYRFIETADKRDCEYTVHKIENQIIVADVGDRSVGIQSMTELTAELNDDFLDFLKEQKTLPEFRKKLQALVEEFYEPECGYDTWMSQDDEAEREFYENEEKENEKID